MIRISFAAIALATTALVAQPAQAEILVFDFDEFAPNSGTANGIGAHGFYTGGTFQNNAWLFDLDKNGSNLTYDTLAGSGKFTAEVINGLGKKGILNLEFSGLMQSLEGTDFVYTPGFGGPANPARQIYFTKASGTFEHESFAQPFVVDTQNPLDGKSVVQFGEDASYYGGDGISAWLHFINPITGKRIGTKWDIGAPLASRNQPTGIPEPAPLALLGMGAAGLVFARRRKNKPVSTR